MVEFKKADEVKGEHIPGKVPNEHRRHFVGVYDLMGNEFFKSHMKYEIDKYLQTGLKEQFL